MSPSSRSAAPTFAPARGEQRRSGLEPGMTIGHATLARRMDGPGPFVRWLAHDTARSPLVLTLVRRAVTAADARRFRLAVEPVMGFRHPHALPVEDAIVDDDGRCWLVLPYAGSYAGLLRLADVIKWKPAGRMTEFEAANAVEQLLSVLAAAERAPLAHGPLSPADLLVDRHGRILVELFGVHHRLRGGDDASALREQLRCAFEIAYHLVTGYEASAPLIRPRRLVHRLSHAWESFLTRGLEGGFRSAEAALAGLSEARAPGSRIASKLSRALRPRG